jgi:hypothetical protein
MIQKSNRQASLPAGRLPALTRVHARISGDLGLLLNLVSRLLHIFSEAVGCVAPGANHRENRSQEDR